MSEPVLPIHVATGRNEANLIYCRRCRHRFGGAYGAIAADACEWSFCPYCGVEIVKTNPYHQPAEMLMERPRWPDFTLDPLKRWPPEVLDGVIEGTARERSRPLLSAGQ
jgi:hypothetical protein